MTDATAAAADDGPVANQQTPGNAPQFASFASSSHATCPNDCGNTTFGSFCRLGLARALLHVVRYDDFVTILLTNNRVALISHLMNALKRRRDLGSAHSALGAAGVRQVSNVLRTLYHASL